MFTLEGIIKWCLGLRSPVTYDWNAYSISVLPRRMRGKSLEWKRTAVYGVVDKDYLLATDNAGWKQVKSVFGKPIEREGQRLMWREKAYTELFGYQTPSLARQLMSAQRGTLPIEHIRYPEMYFDSDLDVTELATRGKHVDWGFDPYAGSEVDAALEAVAKLIKEDQEKERIVQFTGNNLPNQKDNAS